MTHALSRSTDPDTSFTAARYVPCAALEQKVYESLIDAGPAGSTIDELTAALGLQKVTLSPRLRPLCRRGLVVDSAERRRGMSGRLQTVWKATQKNSETLLTNEHHQLR
jgi:predicted ArsR family transcriptional regulator